MPNQSVYVGGRAKLNDQVSWSGLCDHSGLIFAMWITFFHFSVYSTMNLPKSAGEFAKTVLPRSMIRAFILGSASSALISLLSLSMISAGVFFGATMPIHPVAS